MHSQAVNSYIIERTLHIDDFLMEDLIDLNQSSCPQSGSCSRGAPSRKQQDKVEQGSRVNRYISHYTVDVSHI